MLEADAQRRRTKKQIKEDKLKKELKEAEIAQKLKEHAAMQHRMQEMQDKLLDQDKMDEALEHLFEAGLLKRLGNGQYVAVADYNEHQALIGQRREDGRISKQIEQMMQTQPQFSPSDERTRPGTQLEEHTPGQLEQIQPR